MVKDGGAQYTSLADSLYSKDTYDESPDIIVVHHLATSSSVYDVVEEDEGVKRHVGFEPSPYARAL